MNRFFALLSIVISIVLVRPGFAMDASCSGTLTSLRHSLANLVPKMQANFENQQRMFVSYEYGLHDRPPKGERNRDKIRGQIFILVDTSNHTVIWSIKESFKHHATAFILDPTDPNSGYIAKQVEKFAVTEEAAATSKPHRDYPGLSSELAYEVLHIQKKNDGISMREIYDSNTPIKDPKELAQVVSNAAPR